MYLVFMCQSASWQSLGVVIRDLKRLSARLEFLLSEVNFKLKSCYEGSEKLLHENPSVDTSVT